VVDFIGLNWVCFDDEIGTLAFQYVIMLVASTTAQTINFATALNLTVVAFCFFIIIMILLYTIWPTKDLY